MARPRYKFIRLGAIGVASVLALCGNAWAQAAAGASAIAPAAPPAIAPAAPPAARAANSGAGGNGALAPTDRTFVLKAAQGGMAEVALGKMAARRASNPQVRQFGERMASDHGKANEELRQLAGARGMTLPPAPDRAHRHDAERLGTLTGPEFDRGYMKHMLDDHRKDVLEFEKASRSVKDPQVRDFATRTLPTLQAHLHMAQETYDAVRKVSGPAGAASR